METLTGPMAEPGFECITLEGEPAPQPFCDLSLPIPSVPCPSHNLGQALNIF